MSRPSTWTVPEVGRVKPATMFSRVDLPEPEAPSRVRNSPARTSRSTDSRTVLSPYFLLTAPMEIGAPVEVFAAGVSRSAVMSCTCVRCAAVRCAAAVGELPDQPGQAEDDERAEDDEHHDRRDGRHGGVDLDPDAGPHLDREGRPLRAGEEDRGDDLVPADEEGEQPAGQHAREDEREEIGRA